MDETKPCTPIDRDRRARAFARLESIKRREAFALSAVERLELLEELARFAELAAPHRVPGADSVLRARSRESLLAWRRRA
ncbi:MAG: hypothetical protein J0L92_10105 [Deltaproteobacteria bacterium]|nr:hypothetical protein [Deltaproteobacteria bacterium]